MNSFLSVLKCFPLFIIFFRCGPCGYRQLFSFSNASLTFHFLKLHLHSFKYPAPGFKPMTTRLQIFFHTTRPWLLDKPQMLTLFLSHISANLTLVNKSPLTMFHCKTYTERCYLEPLTIKEISYFTIKKLKIGKIRLLYFLPKIMIFETK